MEHNKNHLNTIRQRLFRDSLLQYTYDQSGPCHDPVWQCNIYLDKKPIGLGGGTTKQDASEAAAESAIEYLHRHYYEQYPSAFR